LAEAAFDAAAVRRIAERTGEPGWFADRRLEALDRFDALPWPDPSAEAWRYTKLTGFELNAFTSIGPDRGLGSKNDLPDPVRTATGAAGERAGLAAERDGSLVYEHLDEALAAKGVIFTSLARAAADHPGLLKDALGTAGVSQTDEKFATLASAFSGAGTLLYVPSGVEVAFPVATVRTIETPGLGVFPRVLIVAEEGSSVTYLEHFRSPGLDGAALSVATVEIHAAQSANVSVLAMQDWSPEVWHFNIQRAVVSRDASLRSLAATLGGRLSRSVVETILDGQGAYSEMLGVYFGDSHQHFDHRSLQEHRAPATKSDLYYKGALKGHATAVYSGLIHIAKEAQQADAWQGNRNLILSDHAKADSIPYLEIEANDVRCAHGASVGPPSEDVLFYLRSRGLDPASAEQLVVKGFFQEVLDRVRVSEVREALEAAVEAELELED
jgi:Fe-S cluster assembly protein SufD